MKKNEENIGDFWEIAKEMKLICGGGGKEGDIRQSNGQSVFKRAIQSSKYIYRKEWQERNPRTLKSEQAKKGKGE